MIKKQWGGFQKLGLIQINLVIVKVQGLATSASGDPTFNEPNEGPV